MKSLLVAGAVWCAAAPAMADAAAFNFSISGTVGSIEGEPSGFNTRDTFEMSIDFTTGPRIDNGPGSNLYLIQTASGWSKFGMLEYSVGLSSDGGVIGLNWVPFSDVQLGASLTYNGIKVFNDGSRAQIEINSFCSRNIPCLDTINLEDLNFGPNPGSGDLIYAPGANGKLVPFFANADWTITPLTSGVPEPKSWALMIAGFGLIGYALRRRRERYAPELV